MKKQKISIVEVSPRDGLQNEKQVLSPKDRTALILRSAQAGAKRIEAVSFVNPKRVPQMADAEDVMQLSRAAMATHGLTPNLIGLALNGRGVQRAIACGVDEINCVVVASETFSQRNQNMSSAETLDQMEQLSGAIKDAGIPFSMTIATSFGCPFEGEIDPEHVANLARRSVEMGVFEIALADTIGAASPYDVTHRLGLAMKAAPNVQWRCHFHNTRNTGLANAVAAIQSGVYVLDASIGGIGGCPFAPAATGNIPTEDLSYMLRRMGHDTGLDMEEMRGTAKWLGEKLGNVPAGMLWKSGDFPPIKEA
ncbi:MAG: hydroxymethylglutaryl-CoA lyase [Maricaulaceae bacterium]